MSWISVPPCCSSASTPLKLDFIPNLRAPLLSASAVAAAPVSVDEAVVALVSSVPNAEAEADSCLSCVVSTEAAKEEAAMAAAEVDCSTSSSGNVLLRLRLELAVVDGGDAGGFDGEGGMCRGLNIDKTLPTVFDSETRLYLTRIHDRGTTPSTN